MKPIVVVGAGLSGLAAAVALVSARHPVVLLEQKPAPGGRAVSFVDAPTGTEVDNGQHILIAGYDATLSLLRTLGTDSLLDIQPTPRLVLHHPERGLRALNFPPLPSPLHLLAGVLGSDLFPGPAKREVLRAGLSLLRVRASSLAGMTVGAWLDTVGQSADTRATFWDPLAVAIMNEHTAAASASVFVRSMQQAFLRSRRSAALAIPRVGLSQLFAQPAVRFVQDRGGVVRLGCGVAEVTLRDRTTTAVVLRDGTVIDCGATILAVPTHDLADLLPPALRSDPALAAAASFPLSPIVSIHLWFDGEVMVEPMIGVVGRTIEWIFRKPGYVSAVISAAHEEVGWTNERLAETALADLRAVVGARAGTPKRSLVIREKRATISLTPSVESARPDSRTGVSNLFLAGDWTATGLPATLEGAVVSGRRAAQLALEEAGRG